MQTDQPHAPTANAVSGQNVAARALRATHWLLPKSVVLALALATSCWPIVAAAPSSSGKPAVRFVRELPGDSAQKDIAANVLPLADGALITGWTARSGGPPDGFVVRVDNEANVVWRKVLGGDGTDLLFAAQQDGDGFVCVGFTNSSGAGSTDGWLLKLDGAGNQMWERTAGGEGAERLTSLVPMKEGWMAAGQTARGHGTQAWVVRFDRVGRELSQWTWGGPRAPRGLGLAALADGGCVVTGGMGPSRDSSDAFVTRMSATGGDAWTRVVGGQGFQVAYHLRERRDGSYLVTGYGFQDAERDHDAFVLQLSKDGRQLTRTNLGGPNYDRATQSVELSDGSSITVGYTKRAGQPDDAPAWQTVLYGLDPKGRPTWTHTFEGEGHESGHWIAALGNDVWVASQVTPSTGGSRVLLARLDVSSSPNNR
jgi:hypothetical protein